MCTLALATSLIQAYSHTNMHKDTHTHPHKHIHAHMRTHNPLAKITYLVRARVVHAAAVELTSGCTLPDRTSK